MPDGRRQDACIGGDALYAALAARLFDPATAMLTPVGDDLPSEALEPRASPVAPSGTST